MFKHTQNPVTLIGSVVNSDGKKQQSVSLARLSVGIGAIGDPMVHLRIGDMETEEVIHYIQLSETELIEALGHLFNDGSLQNCHLVKGSKTDDEA